MQRLATHHGARPATGGTARSIDMRAVGGGLKRLWRLYAAWSNRRALRPLLSMSERELADIGITPGDLHGVLSLPFHTDPSAHLADLAIERRLSARLRASGRARKNAERETSVALKVLPGGRPQPCCG